MRPFPGATATINVCNQALADGTISQDQAASFIKQARTLRGWYHFEAWRMWIMVPYLDETTDPFAVTNTEDISDKILADITEGTTLPDDMDQVGRFQWNCCKSAPC